MSHALYRLGRFAARRPWAVIGSWLVVSVLVIGASSAFGEKLEDSFGAPGLDSQKATDLLVARRVGPGRPHGPGGADATRRRTRRSSTRRRRALPWPRCRQPSPRCPSVLGQRPGGRTGGRARVAVSSGLVSPDGRVALIRVQYPVLEELDPADLENLKALGADLSARSVLQVELGGDLFFAFEEPGTGIGEVIGLVVAVLILLVAFGSIIAMGLPIGMALFGLALGISSMSLITYLIDIPSWAPVIGSMVGLGVGIDYALFLVTRHREYLASGMTVEESVGRAVATAGQSVVFAGGTVVIAILGLAVAGVPFMTAAGIAISVIVLVMVVASVTLLPAFLGLAGHRINGFGRRRDRRSRTAEGLGWRRWGGHVTRHAPAYAVGGHRRAAGAGRAGAGPADRHPRRGGASAATAPSAAPTTSSPTASVPASTGRWSSPSTSRRTRASSNPWPGRSGPTEGVASVAPPEVDADAGVATLVAFPTTGPQDSATLDTVERLRAEVIPSVLGAEPGPRPHRWPDGELRRRRRQGQQPAAAVHRRRDRAVVAAADPRVPVGGRAASRRRCSTC